MQEKRSWGQSWENIHGNGHDLDVSLLVVEVLCSGENITDTRLNETKSTKRKTDGVSFVTQRIGPSRFIKTTLADSSNHPEGALKKIPSSSVSFHVKICRLNTEVNVTQVTITHTSGRRHDNTMSCHRSPGRWTRCFPSRTSDR